MLDALLGVGLGTASLVTPEQLLSKEITIFNDVIRIDVQTRTPGIEFTDAWQRRSDLPFRGEPIHFVSRDDLIRSEEAAGRAIDRSDVQVLRSLAHEHPPASSE